MILLLACFDARAAEVASIALKGLDKPILVDLGGFAQPRFDVVQADADAGTDGTIGFALDRARLSVGVRLDDDHIVYEQQISVELYRQPQLMDAWADFGVTQVHLRVGQMKVPSTRASLCPDAQVLLPWQPLGLGWGGKRDVGAEVIGRVGPVIYTVGAFDGEGTNVTGNAGRGLLYEGRVVVGLTGAPAKITELMPSTAEPEVTIGVSGHRNLTGEVGSRTAILGGNADVFVHAGPVTGQVEVVGNHVNNEDATAADYDQLGGYGQVAVLVPSGRLQDHLAGIVRFEIGDAAAGVPPVDALDENEGTWRLETGIGLYGGAPLFRNLNNARVFIGYRVDHETEGAPLRDDAFTIASTVAF